MWTYLLIVLLLCIDLWRHGAISFNCHGPGTTFQSLKIVHILFCHICILISFCIYSCHIDIQVLIDVKSQLTISFFFLEFKLIGKLIYYCIKRLLKTIDCLCELFLRHLIVLVLKSCVLWHDFIMIDPFWLLFDVSFKVWIADVTLPSFNRVGGHLTVLIALAQ